MALDAELRGGDHFINLRLNMRVKRYLINLCLLSLNLFHSSLDKYQLSSH